MVCALAVFGTIAGAMGGPSILALAFGSGREDVTLAALARDPDAAWYTLSDAIVRGDLEYTRRVTSRDRESGRAYTHDHAIAPLVRASWEPGDPIPAWAYCTSRGSGSRYRRCRALWREPRLGVLPARPLSVGEMEETRRLAAADGPRRQGADAPIFEWVEDPIKHMVRETRVGLGLVGATYLLGVLTLLVRRARAARRR
jgi:hypothetical protein